MKVNNLYNDLQQNKNLYNSDNGTQSCMTQPILPDIIQENGMKYQLSEQISDISLKQMIYVEKLEQIKKLIIKPKIWQGCSDVAYCRRQGKYYDIINENIDGQKIFSLSYETTGCCQKNIKGKLNDLDQNPDLRMSDTPYFEFQHLRNKLWFKYICMFIPNRLSGLHFYCANQCYPSNTKILKQGKVVYILEYKPLTMEQQLYSYDEVSQHKTYDSLWVIINEYVYDLSKFAALHPAGRNVLLEYSGQDVTELFNQFHPPSVLHKYHDKLCIGKVKDLRTKPIAPLLKYKNSYGEGIPYGDPNNMQGWNSPYYNQSHHDLRLAYRKFLQQEVAPYIDQWDADKKVPKELFKKAAETGILPIIVGLPWMDKYAPKREICGVKLENPDYFHEMIVLEETIKYSSIGIAWALGSCSIGLPPIIHNGSDFLKDKYVKKTLDGEIMSALAVTEPWAGSDVANIKCQATLTDDGKYYIVNGMKKFITTGTFADIYTTAVRTGDEGFLGVSLLVIERNMPGVKTRAMNMQGVWGSGTAFIIFENVKVPVENRIGEEGLGFMYAMQNFNHERFQQIIECVAGSRVCLEECMKYAHARKTFGKRLIDQPVIREKLAYMIKEVESLQAQLELIAYNFSRMNKKQEKAIASAISLAKAHGTVILEKISNVAVQIFGGNGYQRGGVGTKIERFYREHKSLTNGGGSPEVLFDMGIRMASKMQPKAAL
ncbi:Cytochrome b5-like heme/steroid binding domain [Pseudocohnilembus persalinus]|uniref:Cytochrome b5-like heme/steroid binding domain n=1 Tax=Pseudocohnilembus persalinus TaxID=266149 RepID=A0A0V0QMV6_PSEPJ|nr:Cytochrome b5-like heme/steroid binding domain [Pseudocohnilembus persalinus]|eukprot:KRX03468.1 Cytochrome b5-like heme/steroid binding domain [Pseudocohnilembus persalinus]